MTGFKAGLVRVVFILGKASLISAACKDAGFEQRHLRNSVGDEVELFLVKQQVL